MVQSVILDLTASMPNVSSAWVTENMTSSILSLHQQTTS